MGKIWRFTQLSGERRVMVLAGASAPHGRPRKGPVVTDGIKLRHQRVYYPGGARYNEPTTHIFGIEWMDWELKGRFSYVTMGKHGARAAVRDWQSFVADAQRVSIAWGDIIWAYGIVDAFIPERESESEVAYTIRVLIDRGEVEGRGSHVAPGDPRTLCQRLRAELDANVTKPELGTLAPTAGAWRPDFLDSIEDIVGELNSFSAALLAIADEIDVFVDATFDQLERLRSGVGQFRTAVHKLRNTIDVTTNDAAILLSDADNEIAWAAWRAETDVATTSLLSILEELDREVDLARRGRALARYVARLGDTWESISSAFYGGPSEAGAIRNANGVLYGAMPIPGREYIVPTSP